MSTKQIKILVACHKPSELPQNNLFLPIQVGASLAKNQLHIQRDDEGENISDKNPQYCELTAQYWAWKNLEADYYGLCHYRRFLCFDDKNAKRNNRDQIEVGIANQKNFDYFGLNNQDAMKKEIEKYDIVTGVNQKIKNIPTPYGNKKTAYKHWVAHDKALIMTKDLECMLKILDQVSPEVGSATREYLNSPVFSGFNCFVMKKDLFDQMCSIEFEVLSRLEKKVDLSHYCQQLTRIYGFMGEIISSGFIYYIEKQHKYKVKHVPLIYFNFTDKVPAFSFKENSIPIIFYHADYDTKNFGVIWKSFLQYAKKENNYDAILFADSDSLMQKTLLDMAKGHNNVSLRFCQANQYRDEYFKQYNFGNDLTNGLKKFSLLQFLPYIFSDIKKTIVLTENIIIQQSLDDLWKKYKNEQKIIQAPHNVFTQGNVNGLFPEWGKAYLERYMKNPLGYFNVCSMIWDFEQYRQNFSEEKISKLTRKDKNTARNREEIMNILCEENKGFITQDWGTIYETTEFLRFRISYAPFENFKANQDAQKKPSIISYFPDDVFLPNFNILTQTFWDIARTTPFYQNYLTACMEYTSKQYLPHYRQLIKDTVKRAVKHVIRRI